MIPEVRKKTFLELLHEWTVFHPVVAGVAFVFALILFILLVVRCCHCYKSRRTLQKRAQYSSSITVSKKPKKVNAVQLPDGEIVTEDHARVLDTVFSTNSDPRALSHRFWAALGRSDPKAGKQS
jgi:hypothetical protein